MTPDELARLRLAAEALGWRNALTEARRRVLGAANQPRKDSMYVAALLDADKILVDLLNEVRDVA